MGYFSNFPQYVTKLPDGNQITITDFFRRIQVTDRYKANVTTLMPYTIQDGEQPEMIANRIYGSPYYHWVIFHINNIINVVAEWPLSYQALVSKVYYTYDFDIEVPDVTEFEVGDVLTTSGGGTLKVTDIGYISISARSTNNQTFIDSETTMTNSRTQEQGMIVLDATDPQYVIHHYEDANTGYQIDYNALDPNCIPITNLEYEINENEKKRDIKLLDPTYLQDFVKTFTDEINS